MRIYWTQKRRGRAVLCLLSFFLITCIFEYPVKNDSILLPVCSGLAAFVGAIPMTCLLRMIRISRKRGLSVVCSVCLASLYALSGKNFGITEILMILCGLIIGIPADLLLFRKGYEHFSYPVLSLLAVIRITDFLINNTVFPAASIILTTALTFIGGTAGRYFSVKLWKSPRDCTKTTVLRML